VDKGISMQRLRGRFGVLVLAAAVLQACSDNPSSSVPMASAMTGEGGLAASAPVATEVRPAVVVQDESGRPVPGSQVTFEVTAGGGTLASATVGTDARGRAEARWTLGTAMGTNRVTARAGSRTVTFAVEGTAGAPTTMTAIANAPDVAPVSGAVGVIPAVQLRDAYGNAVAGVAVDFSVTAGGGVVHGGAAVSDAGGIASVGGWTAGPAAGENTLVATSAGLPPVTFTTRGVASSSSWLHLTKFAGDGTTCPADTNGCVFTVRVRDTNGSAVAGESVVWTGPGGATSTTVTNAGGLATSPNLGARALGSYTQSARLAAASEQAVFSYEIVQPGGFNIDLRFVGNEPSAAVKAAFEAARSRWQQVITGNLPAFPLTGANAVAADACGITHPAVNETVDDLLIFAEIVPIDGPGKVLGSAGPCLIRGAGGLPILGVIKLDSDDLDMMSNSGTLRDVILHEIGHVLGLGTLWTRFRLLEGAGTSDPFYVGNRAQSGFVLGGGIIHNGIPVENTGGQGTRDGHWRETTLANELMTGFINGGTNPLSTITIGSLMDMGYQVNFGAADAYALPGRFGSSATDGVRHEMIELPLPEPRRVW
jgi:hypothetical protein